MMSLTNKIVSWVLEILDFVLLITKWIIWCSHLWTLVFFVHQILLTVEKSSLTLSSYLSKIIRVKTHILRVRISLDFIIWVHIFQSKLSITFVRTYSFVSLHISLSFNDLISTVMAEIIETTLTHKHTVEITEAYWAIVFELITKLSVLR